MTIAVVGANGFVGSALVNHLEASRVRVKPLDRSNSPDLATGRVEDWKPVLAGCEVLVNCAGKAHDLSRPTLEIAREYALVNAVAPREMARAARAMGLKKVIHLSTVKVLGTRTSGTPFAEVDPLQPEGIYATSKAEGEVALLEALEGGQTEPVIVRIPLVIGIPRKGNLALLEAAITRRIPLPLGHPAIGRRSYARLEELTRFLRVVADAKDPLPSVLHFRSPPDLSAGELTLLLGREIDTVPRLMPVPPAVLKLSAALAGRPNLANKLTEEMLVSDSFSRSVVSR